LARPGAFAQIDGMLDELDLNTVCQSAKCPNRGECFSEGTATFLVLGDACTRGCRFCAVETRRPQAPDPGEPARVGEAVARMGLRHAVVTMVTRDDLADGGAAHIVAVIKAIGAAAPGAAVEVLVSDFGGDLTAVDAVVDARPDVFNHNVETVPRLYEMVRPGADYERSLGVLAHAAARHADVPTKSGLMLGLGETADEVRQVMRDLRRAGCAMLTLGQYLRPSANHLPVVEFVVPERFAELARTAYSLGFTSVASAPFVRSSYHAAEQAETGA
jgi:lipoic acid synthetase